MDISSARRRRHSGSKTGTSAATLLSCGTRSDYSTLRISSGRRNRGTGTASRREWMAWLPLPSAAQCPLRCTRGSSQTRHCTGADGNCTPESAHSHKRLTLESELICDQTFVAFCCHLAVEPLAAAGRPPFAITRGRGLSYCFEAVLVRLKDAAPNVALHLGVVGLPVREVGEEHIEPPIHFLQVTHGFD